MPDILLYDIFRPTFWDALCHTYIPWYIRADSRFAPSQWETALQSNAVSHWLGANLESALYMHSFVMLCFVVAIVTLLVSYRMLPCEYWVVGNWHSRMLFASEDKLCINLHVQENQWIGCHNASILSSRDVTGQLWWCHNAKSERTIPGDNGKISDDRFQCIFCVCSGHK